MEEILVCDTSSQGNTPTCQISLISVKKSKRSEADTILTGRTDAHTDRLITIGCLPLCGGALTKEKSEVVISGFFKSHSL